MHLAGLLAILLASVQAWRAAAQSWPPPGTLGHEVLNKYFTNDEMSAWMDEYVARCRIARKFSIGKSVLGAQLWALEISDKPGQSEAEPNYKFVGNMHGDEPASRQLLMALAEWLCMMRAHDQRAQRMVTDMHVYILPTVNPDGFAAKRRENSNNVDLNRNFPDPIKNRGADLSVATPIQEPETKAMMRFTQSTRFSGAISLHEGALVANYPFDGYPDGSMVNRGKVNPSPDHSIFVYLAKMYAAKHPSMHLSKEFASGITNGAAWYPVYGGMQDWDYLVAQCLDLTIEINDDKWPPAMQLSGLWQQNKDALVDVALTTALGGIRGRVIAAAQTKVAKPLAARIHILGMGRNITADPATGFYTRPLMPGRYTMRVEHPGYHSQQVALQVPSNGQGIVREVRLAPESAHPRMAHAVGPLNPLDPKFTVRSTNGAKGSGTRAPMEARLGPLRLVVGQPSSNSMMATLYLGASLLCFGGAGLAWLGWQATQRSTAAAPLPVSVLPMSTRNVV